MIPNGPVIVDSRHELGCVGAHLIVCIDCASNTIAFSTRLVANTQIFSRRRRGVEFLFRRRIFLSIWILLAPVQWFSRDLKLMLLISGEGIEALFGSPSRSLRIRKCSWKNRDLSLRDFRSTLDSAQCSIPPLMFYVWQTRFTLVNFCISFGVLLLFELRKIIQENFRCPVKSRLQCWGTRNFRLHDLPST